MWRERSELKQMYILYKHTTPSGKVYIGITAQAPAQRWRNGGGYNHSPHFKSAIKKYGWGNIKHEILFENLTKEEAEQKEVEQIAKYKSTDKRYGYNTDSGGSVNKKHSEETKNKIRKAHLGMKYDEAFKEKQRKLKTGNKNRLGQRQTEEAKRKISEKNKGKFAGEKNYFSSHKFIKENHSQAKAVDKYDMNGNLLDHKECAKYYAEEMGLLNASHIIAVCRGKRKSAYGYIWRYSDGGVTNGAI